MNPAADGYVTVYPCGPRPVASTVNFRAGEIVPNFTLVPYSGGEVCLYAFADTNVVVDSFGWTGGDGLVLASPSRLLDTRSGVGAAGGPASPSHLVQLRVAGRAGVPNDVTAAFVTVTATGGSADGFVTAYPSTGPARWHRSSTSEPGCCARTWHWSTSPSLTAACASTPTPSMAHRCTSWPTPSVGCRAT